MKPKAVFLHRLGDEYIFAVEAERDQVPTSYASGLPHWRLVRRAVREFWK